MGFPVSIRDGVGWLGFDGIGLMIPLLMVASIITINAGSFDLAIQYY